MKSNPFLFVTNAAVDSARQFLTAYAGIAQTSADYSQTFIRQLAENTPADERLQALTQDFNNFQTKLVKQAIDVNTKVVGTLQEQHKAFEKLLKNTTELRA